MCLRTKHAKLKELSFRVSYADIACDLTLPKLVGMICSPTSPFGVSQYNESHSIGGSPWELDLNKYPLGTLYALLHKSSDLKSTYLTLWTMALVVLMLCVSTNRPHPARGSRHRSKTTDLVKWCGPLCQFHPSLVWLSAAVANDDFNLSLRKCLLLT